MGIFGQTAKFGQPSCLFHISNIGIKNKLTKQTVKILMRRPYHLDFYCLQMCVRIYLMSEFTRLYLTVVFVLYASVQNAGVCQEPNLGLDTVWKLIK